MSDISPDPAHRCCSQDAAGETPTDGLAQLFSLEADAATPEQRSRAARAAALLFSLAERALLTAERVEELEKAQLLGMLGSTSVRRRLVPSGGSQNGHMSE